MALDDRGQVEAGGQRPVDAARAGRAARRRTRRATSGAPWRTSSEPCSVTASSSSSRRAPCSSGSASSRSSRSIAASSRASAPAARRTSARNASAVSGSRLERAQHVERVDVAGALPDRVERALAEEARQLRLLDVAVAAEALERLRDERRRPLADPELRDRGREPPERPVGLVVGAREPERGHGRGLRLDAEVGEHVLHQRLLGEQAAERGAVRGVVGRLRDGAAHQRRRAEHAVEPRVVDHLEDRPDAAALLADEPRRRRRRARSRPRRSSGCRACPSAARSGSRAAAARAGSRRARPAPARARGTRRSSARSRTTCARRAPRRRPSGRAVVSFARTSEPPWRSVIAIPQSASPPVSRGIHSAARSGCVRSAGTAAKVIESGQPTPASTWPSSMKSAARATCAPGRSSTHGSECTRASSPSRSSESQAGWNSISSIRSP